MTNGLLNYKRILVVDDEPDVLETLEEILSIGGAVPRRCLSLQGVWT